MEKNNGNYRDYRGYIGVIYGLYNDYRGYIEAISGLYRDYRMVGSMDDRRWASRLKAMLSSRRGLQTLNPF